jgi:hypothetical protein
MHPFTLGSDRPEIPQKKKLNKIKLELRRNRRIGILASRVARRFHFHTKNPNLGKIWRALEWKMFLNFMTLWNIFGHLV